MLRILKRLPAGRTTLAIACLLLQTGCSLYLPYLTAGIVNRGIVDGNIPLIWRQGGVMLIFTLISLVGALLNMYIAGNIAFRLGRNLRDDVFVKALSFSKGEYDQFGISGLITRNTNDVTQVQNVVEMFLKFLILSPLYLIGGIFMTWKLSPSLAIPVILSLPFMIVAAVVIYRVATPLYGTMQTLLDRLNQLFREGVTGVRVIRAFTREQEDYQKYEETNRAYTKRSIAAGTVMSIFVPLITLCLNLATLGVVWIGGNAAADGSVEVGSIMAAVSYGAQILMGFALLTNVLLTLPRGQVSAVRIYEVLHTNPCFVDGPREGGSGQICLSMEDASFRYPGAEKQVLSGISLAVKQGQTLAIIGGTGDGKTSLLSLITRMYDVESGSVLIGEVDVREWKQAALYDRISYAPQKSALLAGTVRSNMLLAKPDADDREMWSALDTACARAFVEHSGLGLDAPVEKGGGNFSGGQRQRLCIARTLLKDADIYLFDDSFSALDFKTDAAVRSAIHKRLRDKITVIVAQRVGTVAQADLIAVLEKGRLAGLGTHQELLKSSPVYWEIVRSQGYEEGVA